MRVSEYIKKMYQMYKALTASIKLTELVCLTDAVKVAWNGGLSLMREFNY